MYFLVWVKKIVPDNWSKAILLVVFKKENEIYATIIEESVY